MTNTTALIFLIEFSILFGVFVISLAALVQESLRHYGQLHLVGNIGLAFGMSIGVFELSVIAAALFKDYSSSFMFP